MLSGLSFGIETQRGEGSAELVGPRGLKKVEQARSTFSSLVLDGLLLRKLPLVMCQLQFHHC